MSVLRNSRTATVQVRGFASSSNLRVGPESPHFVDVPRIIQPTNPRKPHVRGTLPVPRELFPARRADKPRIQYLNAVTQLPKTERVVSPNSSNPEKQEWKHKMADLRRQNLRDGLRDLYSRKRSADSKIISRSLENQNRRDRILQQPEREDERLTRPSTIEAMMPHKQPVLPDPNREERLALSRARLEAKQAQKEIERKEHLQSLYVNARTFITTEEQLNAEIDRVFPEGENPAWRNDHQPGENIWNLGNPPTVFNLANKTRSNEAARWDVSQERVKKLGEALTGVSRITAGDVPTGTAEEIEGDRSSSYVAGLVPTQEGTGRIYSVAWDDTIRSIDIGAKTYTGSSSKLSGQPKGVAAGDATVLVATSESVEIHKDGQKVGDFKAEFSVTAVAAHGSVAAVGGDDSTVQFCDISGSNLTPKRDIKASRNPISALAFSPDASHLAVGDLRGRVLVFKVADGSLVTDRWTAHTARITSLAWNEGGSHVVSGSLDTNIFVWSLAKPGDWLELQNAHKEGVHGVGWVAGGSKIISAGADAAVKVWKVEGLK